MHVNNLPLSLNVLILYSIVFTYSSVALEVVQEKAE